MKEGWAGVVCIRILAPWIVKAIFCNDSGILDCKNELVKKRNAFESEKAEF